MEKASENKFVLSAGELKSNGEKLDEFKSSSICSASEVCHSLPNSTERSEQFRDIRLMEKTSQGNKAKPSKISSVLDPYCSTSILNESADFVVCESANKFKCGNSKREFFSCEICNEDITNLDVYSRGVHVNDCIDKQISTAPEPSAQTSETENVFILECPLCFKHFLTPELRANHVKKCGKSKGLSTQSIIKALELQERHALERISLGLPAKPIKAVKSHKNPVSKKAIVEPKNKAQSDIQLAKALSLSLTNSVEQTEVQSSEKLTLMTLKPPAVGQYPGKKAKKILNTPLLVLRSEEDRKKLLLDKVAAIVAPVSTSENDSPMDTEDDVSSMQRKEDPCEVPSLWQLSRKCSEKYDYYVDQLLNWIKPSDVDVGAKLFHLSQIPGHEIVTQLPCEYTFSSQEQPSCIQSSVTDSLPSSLTDCLRSLVASSWMSDVDIHTACGTVVPAHRLLLAVRCPTLKQDSDFCSSDGRVSVKWENISFNAALQFLNFIYTGNIEVEENIQSDLLHLAKKYEVYDLEALLHTNQKNNVMFEMESGEKVPLDDGNKNSSFSLHLSSPLQALEVAYNIPCKSQEDTNEDLEIVYNCINSTLKPSQPYMNETENYPLESEMRENSRLSPFMEYDKSFHGSSQKCTIPNCALPEHICPKSPEIFDVDDSESEVYENKDLINCSQKSLSKHSNLEVELDLYTTESNSSQDSVKFLQASFTSHNSLNKTPEKWDNSFNPASPKFSKLPNPVVKESPSPSVVNDMSRDSQKSIDKSCRQNTDACTNSELSISLHCKSPHDKNLGKIQTFDDINLTGISTVNSSNKDPFACQISELKIKAKIQSSINEANTHLSLITPESMRIHSLISNDNISEDYQKDSVSTNSFLNNSSNVLSAAEKSSCIEYASPRKKKASLELLICDSDSNSNSHVSTGYETPTSCNWKSNFPQYHMKPNCLNAESSSPNFAFMSFKEERNSLKNASQTQDKFLFPSFFITNAHDVSLERRNGMSPEFISCSGDEDDISTLDGHSFMDNEKNELEETLSFGNKPNKEVVSNMQDLPKLSQTSYELVDDPVYEPYEYFEHAVLSSPEVPGNILPAKNHHSTEAGLSHPVENSVKNAEKNGSCENAATPCSKPTGSYPSIQLTDSPVTPFPNYKNMVTPDIKQALKKIGVKALPRKKAVALLSHVYSETHPLINGEKHTGISPQKEQKASKVKKRKNVNENVVQPAKKQQKKIECPETATQDSDDSNSENPEWQGCVPEISFSQFNQDSPIKANKDDIELIKQYMQSNEELYSNILTYKPLNIVTFHQELKDNGIKISIQKLIDFLDEQCITFTCPRKEEYKKKQAVRSQRFRKKMIVKLSQAK